MIRNRHLSGAKIRRNEFGIVVLQKGVKRIAEMNLVSWNKNPIVSGTNFNCYKGDVQSFQCNRNPIVSGCSIVLG